MTDPDSCAFPCPEYVQGLTKREYFAAAAIQGCLAANPRIVSIECFADDAVRAADALVARLNDEEVPA